MKRPASLRRRLVIAGAGGLVFAALMAAWLLGAAFERAAERALDRRLDEDLDHLIALAEPSPEGHVRLAREPVDERYDRIFSGWYWAVLQSDGAATSRSSWDQAALESVLAEATAQRMYREIQGPREQRLRVAMQRVRFSGTTGDLAFAVAGDLSQTHAEARDFRWFAALAVAAIVAALLAAMSWQVGFGLRPLRRVGDTLRRVRSGEDARFALDELPAEVMPLAAQVNDLLDDHDRRVERARHAAQDLAHALKTPLTVLALESERPDAEFPARVREHVARMRSSVERQLAGAIGADARQRTAIRPVLESLCALLSRAHAGRAVRATIDCAAELRFAGRREDLEEMLGNLLDNAFKWARSELRASAAIAGGTLTIALDDDGPGLDDEQLAHVLTRGVRLDERKPGSGLGLGIVRDVARAYGGVLTLERSALGGLRARLAFPAPAA